MRLAEEFLEERINLNDFSQPKPEEIAIHLSYGREPFAAHIAKDLVPLSPNWRLAPNGTGVRLIPHCEKDPAKRRCDFEIVAKFANNLPARSRMAMQHAPSRIVGA